MRFLIDECTGPGVARHLKGLGYEVFSVYDSARGPSDDLILEKANNENWILVTNDGDFGEKVFRENRKHQGIVFLRLQDERTEAKIAVLEKLIAGYCDQIPGAFVVLTESQVRFGRES